MRTLHFTLAALLSGVIALPALSAMPDAGEGPSLPRVPPATHDAGGQYDTPPRLPKGFEVPYPERLKGSGNVGAVLVRARVSASGLLSDLAVLQSHHAAIEDAVIDALLDARMEPATRNGHPVEATVLIPIQFKYRPPQGRWYAREGILPYTLPKKSGDTLPAELRYDKPPRPVLATLPVYPYALAQLGVEGSAKVAFVVGQHGRVTETRILESSHPEFGLATAAMLESWTFLPARRDGQPTAAMFVKEQTFSGDNRDTALTDVDQGLLDETSKADTRPYVLTELDHVPAARYRITPPYPRALAGQSLHETVMIEFILDKAGRVHLPRIVDAVHPEFGWSAATALARWRFEPPLRQGQPVLARLRIPFEFKPAEHAVQSREFP